MTHAALPGGWRTITLQNVVRGDEPLDRALEFLQIRKEPDLSRIRQDLTDAIAAYEAGDAGTALAVATSIGKDLKQARPGRVAAA